MCAPTSLLLGLLAIIFPPFTVWIKRGLCSADSIINLALCMLGYLPGLLHAWYIIAVTPDDYGYETVPDEEAAHGAPTRYGGATTYYYVSAPSQQFGQQYGGHSSTMPAQRSDRGYGTPDHGYGTIAAPPGPSTGGTGNAEEMPPTYDNAIKGDNKVQRS